MRGTIFLCILVIVSVIQMSSANYKKLPFNGSIFGKRSNVEYDSTGQVLSALCEIASETCQAWYQALENK
ncbi:neuropeptide SIFamide [Bicyclus anynana]|uniref:Neuropeptide SIFamide n=1 Tax=Bicyclus anynana TaxID=110368 RepID=A0ABM3LVA9_BICAN|nr:neuropeptide SIFamide [Bicyclus anynana]